MNEGVEGTSTDGEEVQKASCDVETSRSSSEGIRIEGCERDIRCSNTEELGDKQCDVKQVKKTVTEGGKRRASQGGRGEGKVGEEGLNHLSFLHPDLCQFVPQPAVSTSIVRRLSSDRELGRRSSTSVLPNLEENHIRKLSSVSPERTSAAHKEAEDRTDEAERAEEGSRKSSTGSRSSSSRSNIKTR